MGERPQLPPWRAAEDRTLMGVEVKNMKNQGRLVVRIAQREVRAQRES